MSQSLVSCKSVPSQEFVQAKNESTLDLFSEFEIVKMAAATAHYSSELAYRMLGKFEQRLKSEHFHVNGSHEVATVEMERKFVVTDRVTFAGSEKACRDLGATVHISRNDYEANFLEVRTFFE